MSRRVVAAGLVHFTQLLLLACWAGGCHAVYLRPGVVRALQQLRASGGSRRQRRHLVLRAAVEEAFRWHAQALRPTVLRKAAKDAEPEPPGAATAAQAEQRGGLLDGGLHALR